MQVGLSQRRLEFSEEIVWKKQNHLYFILKVVLLISPSYSDSSAGKESTCNAGDAGSIPGSGRSPGEGIRLPTSVYLVFPGDSEGKESSCNAGNPGLTPGWGKSAGEGIRLPTPVFLGLPGGSAGKESACNAGDPGSIPGLGRSPGEGKGYPLQDSGLENSMDCIVHGVAKSRT